MFLSDKNKAVAHVQKSWSILDETIWQAPKKKVLCAMVHENVIKHNRKGFISTMIPTKADNDIEMDNRRIPLMGRYKVGKLLGQGAFAKVYHARNIKTDQEVAIKVLDKDMIYEPRHEEQIKKEITALRIAKHPNIVELFEVMASKKKIYLVLEYAEGGELFDKVVKGKLQEDVARRYFQQLISAVDYCHSRGVYHRDLKPKNLLLDKNGKLKVSDFGVSTIVDRKNRNALLATSCGTRAYNAPEVIMRRRYDGAKADIWSCGVILFFLLAGHNPFQDDNLLEMYKKILNSNYKCPRWFSFEVQKLIALMLNPSPYFRFPIAKIREYPWFRLGLDDKNMIQTAETREQVPMDAYEASNSSDSIVSVLNQDATNIPHLNAFDIIPILSGFGRSNLFDDSELKKEAWFTTMKPAPTIISQLENVAKSLELKVRKEAGLLRIVESKEGRKGILVIDAQIFEVAPTFYMVEIKKSNGDTLEYQKLFEGRIRPALKDIVWAWQCDEQQQES